MLGAGQAGKLALAAARDSMSGGNFVAVDVDRQAVAAVEMLGLCDVGVVADLRDPIAATAALQDAGVPPADLTVVVVNAKDCEATALLLTAESGTVLFFSMATSFGGAQRSRPTRPPRPARMVVGSGFSSDRGSLRLDLVRALGAAATTCSCGRQRGVMTAPNGHRVQMRWRDLDGLGDGSHTVVLTYLEEARDAFLKGHGISRDEYVVGRCSVRFLSEVDPDRTSRHRAVLDPGARGDRASRRASASSTESGQRRRRGRVRDRLWDPKSRGSRVPSPTKERASLAHSGEERAYGPRRNATRS